MLLGFELVSNPHFLASVYGPCQSNVGGDLVLYVSDVFGIIWVTTSFCWILVASNEFCS